MDLTSALRSFLREAVVKESGNDCSKFAGSGECTTGCKNMGVAKGAQCPFKGNQNKCSCYTATMSEAEQKHWIQLDTDGQERYKQNRKAGMSHPDAINKAKEKPKMDEAEIDPYKDGYTKTTNPDRADYFHKATNSYWKKDKAEKKPKEDKSLDATSTKQKLMALWKSKRISEEQFRQFSDSISNPITWEKVDRLYSEKKESTLGHFVKGKFVALTEAEIKEGVKDSIEKQIEELEYDRSRIMVSGSKDRVKQIERIDAEIRMLQARLDKLEEASGAMIKCTDCNGTGKYTSSDNWHTKGSTCETCRGKGKFKDLTAKDKKRFGKRINKLMGESTESTLREKYLGEGNEIKTDKEAEEFAKDLDGKAKEKYDQLVASGVKPKRALNIVTNESVVREGLPDEQEEREGDANKDAIADKEAEDAMDDEQKDDTQPEVKADNPNPDEVEEEDETEDTKEYLGNTIDQHYYLVRENGELKVQDAAGEVEFTEKDLGTTDKNDFIRKACEKLELNVSYETLEQNDWFVQTQAPLPQATPQDAAAVGPVGSNPHPPEPEIPAGEATIGEPQKPDLKPLSKESDALVTGAEPLEDEMTVGEEDAGAEPEVKEQPVKDNAAQSKYKERKPQDKGTAMRGNTPNPGKKMKEAKDESNGDRKVRIDKKMDKVVGKKCTTCSGTGHRSPEGGDCKKCNGTGVMKESVKEGHSEGDQIFVKGAKKGEVITRNGKSYKVIELDEYPIGTPGGWAKPIASKEVSEFTAHLDGKGEVKEITIEEDFNVHGHHTKVGDNNHVTEALMVKYGLKEGKDLRRDKDGKKVGMRSKADARAALDEEEISSVMFEDNRTFESAVNELVREVMEGLGDLNEAGDEKDFRKKVANEIAEASRWGYERKDAGMIKEKAFKKIMRKMKKMQEDKDTKANYDVCPECGGKASGDNTVCKTCSGKGQVPVKAGTIDQDDEDQSFAGQDPNDYIDNRDNHELVPTDQNKMLESKTWEDKRSYKSLIKGLTRDVMEALEGLKETNRGSIMEEIEFCGQYCLEGRSDASYIKKAVLKKVQRKLTRKAAGEGSKMEEGSMPAYGDTEPQKAAFAKFIATAHSIGLKIYGAVMINTRGGSKDLVIDLTQGGGEVMIGPDGYCEMDNMQFDPRSAEQIKDILDSGKDIRGMRQEKKTEVDESINVEEWEYNQQEGTIDLYGGGDFIDSFNFMELAKQFMDKYNPDNAGKFAKADIQKGWIVFRDAEGTELASDPMDELVDFWAELRQDRITPEGEKPPQTITGEPSREPIDPVEESLYKKYVGV